MTKVKLKFVVPHSLFSEGLIYMLAALDRYEIAEEPDVWIADMSMLGFVNTPGAKVVVIGRDAMPTATEFVKMIEHGARAYVRSGATRDTLVHIIELVYHNNAVLPAEVLEVLRRPFPEPITLPVPVATPCAMRTLTPRELELLPCLRQGMSNKHIAQHTKLAEATVKVHVKAIMRKLRLDNRTQIAVWAASNGQGTQDAR